MGSASTRSSPGGCAQGEEEEEEEEEAGEEEKEAAGEGAAALSRGSGVCKWFNVRMGFGFLSVSSRDGAPPERPLDVFVHQSKLHMEGFRSLREGEAVEFTFKKSLKGLESVRVTGPNGAPCLGSERRAKSTQKRRSKGDRCYNCGGPGHHAKECQLPPQPKKCHFCQSVSHMVADCPVKAQQQRQQQRQRQRQHSSPGSQNTAASWGDEEEGQSQATLSENPE